MPLAVTGTAGGVVSAIAFTPDVFMPLLSGALRDAYPGAEGYRYLFLSTAGMCAAGLIRVADDLFQVRQVEDPSPDGFD